ncbi:MAG: T9SS type A sorting domain-containing protein [Gemmatimonadetes bacterium]|jgi:hypothetical protein|nr:T9SS type A sorting domain-containing protein [Gemmatimonadota bacterium]
MKSAYLAIAAAVTLIATTATGADVEDYALRCASDQWHEVDVGLVSTTGDQYTVEAWVRLATDIPTDDVGSTIVGQHADGTDAKGTLDVHMGRLRFLINTSQSQHHELMSDHPAPLGVWAHMAGVYDGVHMKLYIDGQQAGELPVTGSITGYDKRRGTRIGGYSGTYAGDCWLDGDIDEVRIWDVARTQEQLLADMFHPISPRTGLIGYWRFDEGSGSTTADLSGNNHHGQLTNYRGSGQPAWVPGVFTQIDTLERRQAALADRRLPGIFLDLDMSAGDQRLSTLQNINPGEIYWLQLHVKDAPEIGGWSATIRFDPEKLQFVEDSFQPSDFIPGLSGKTNLVEEGWVEVGGDILSTDARSSGSGFLGTVAFEVSSRLEGGVEILLSEVTFARADGSTLREQTLSRAWLIAGDGFTAVLEPYREGVPATPTLSQNFPNPFNAATRIRFQIPEASRARLEVFDLKGQHLAVLAERFFAPGYYETVWEGRDAEGRKAASGIYLIRLETGSYQQVRKALLVR